MRAARGTAAAFASQAIGFALSACVTIILARLLSPEQFGVFAIAFAFISLLAIAQHGGMVIPLVQTTTLAPEQLAAAFWFNAAVGALLTVVACGMAPIAGWLYADPRLAPLIAVLGLGFFFSAISTTHLALLRRDLRFARLAACEVTALTVASSAAVVSAWFGAGYWALVWLHVTRQVVLSLLLLAIGDRVPPPTRNWPAIAPLVRFGRLLMTFEFIGFLNSRIDNLIVGWFAGPAALGFYAKAFEFLLLPVNQINMPLGNVVQATLSRLQDDPRRFRDSLLRGVLLGASLGMPLVAFLYGHAALVIDVMLGSRWLPSAPIFRALAPAAFVMTVTTAAAWIFMSTGRARRQLPWSIFTTAVTVAAFFVGARHGALGVATAFTVARLVLFVPTLAFTCHGTPVTWTSIIRTVARPAVASAAALIGSTLTIELLPSSPWSLPVIAGVFAGVYVICWSGLPGGVPLVRQQIILGRSLYRSA